MELSDRLRVTKSARGENKTNIVILKGDLSERSRVNGEVGTLPALWLILLDFVRPKEITTTLWGKIRKGGGGGR